MNSISDTNGLERNLRLIEDTSELYLLKDTISTNTFAKKLAQKGSPEGTVVIANKQKGGRGRKINTWFSPPNVGIYLSLIIRPLVKTNTITLLSLMTGISVAKTLQDKSGLSFILKWPNDIFCNNKKIGGILIETSTFPGKLNHAVIGIGLNINNPTGSFPEGISQKATSLLIEKERPFTKDDIIVSLIKNIFYFYKVFIGDDRQEIITTWKSFSNSINQDIVIKENGRLISGTILDINPMGHLVIKTISGKIIETTNIIRVC